jgi:hypothetical protein
MRIIELDAGGWATPLDFLDVVRRAIGAPEGRGTDVDAIVDWMVRGGGAKPPYTIRIAGTAKAPCEVGKEIEALAKALKDASLWRHNHRYDDIGVAIETAP